MPLNLCSVASWRRAMHFVRMARQSQPVIRRLKGVPVKNVVHHLRLGQKFLLIGALAVVMLAAPSTIAMRHQLRNLDTASRQAAGLEPASRALRLIQLTQQHRGMSAAALSGNAAMATQRAAKQDEVDRAMLEARQGAQTLQAGKLGAAASKIADDWTALSRGVASGSLTPAQSFQQHTELIARELELLDDMANVSGLSLNPSPGGHFLQQAVLENMPHVTEALGQMRAKGSAMLARGEPTSEERSQIHSLSVTAREHFQSAYKALGLASEADPALKQSLAASLEAAKSASDEGAKLVEEQIVGAQKATLSSSEYFSAMTRVIDAQFGLIKQSLQSLDTTLNAEAGSARWGLGALTLTLVGLGALSIWILWAVIHTVTRSIGEALDLAEAVADCDLRTEIQAHSRDEIGQLLRALGRMNDHLTEVVGKVRRDADGVAQASAGIARGNRDLSARTEAQASALEQTAASMEQLAATVQQNADHVREASTLSNTAAGVAVHGGDVVGRVVQTMHGINDSSRKISDIIGVIDGIAFQTNILALNAAVEAARAGEQGRGFAVVASEVRSLAQRSAAAAKEIKILISDSVERVQQGATLVDQAGSTMSEVVAAIQRVTQLMSEISSATSEQSAGVAQIGQAVVQMDNATQQNAALVEESAASAEKLQEQALDLVDAVSAFKLR